MVSKSLVYVDTQNGFYSIRFTRKGNTDYTIGIDLVCTDARRVYLHYRLYNNN